jgi:hypothetical protein
VADGFESYGGEAAHAALRDFEIEIIGQKWITDELESVRSDLCSHGDIRLVIGGRVIAPGDGRSDYTISTSALALLRTLDSDYASGDGADNQLILHCGMILMTSCPIGIYWSATHGGGRVRLTNVAVCEEIGSVRDFSDLSVDLAEDEYRSQIVAFAKKAKGPFVGIEKVFHEDWEQELYEEFWREYEVRLGGAIERQAG